MNPLARSIGRFRVGIWTVLAGVPGLICLWSNRKDFDAAAKDVEET